MDFDQNIPFKIKVILDAFLFRQTMGCDIDRPVQAWQWMNQSRSLPDECDWVREDVFEAWRRCLDDYQLPLSQFSSCKRYQVQYPTAAEDYRALEIARFLNHLSHNFAMFLQEAGMMLVLTRNDGSLLYTLGEIQFTTPLLYRLSLPEASWSEAMLGNNGIGSAALLKKPIAFQGMEHFLSVLHPFTTVGYPMLDDTGELVAVIGLICDHQDKLHTIFAFLHFICVLILTNLPLVQSPAIKAGVPANVPMQAFGKRELEVESTVSTELQQLVNKAVRLQEHKISILITGESGVGKDHFVHLLKNAGPRHNQALVAINCASIPHELIESELFGYAAGSFTGAKSNGKAGKFLLADKGILFLDEIGDMSLDLQSTLLRVLETSEITPVGGSKPIHVDVQIVAATNVRLLDAVEAGRFRRDLYYRLNGAQIHLPPLRERRDKKLLIRQILQREMAKLPESKPLCIAADVIELIEDYSWPGNIRQLINVLRSFIFTAGGPVITRADLPMEFLDEINLSAASGNSANNLLDQTPKDPQHPNMSAMSLLEWEVYVIQTTLQECKGNIAIAAKRLKITRATLYKKIERFGLNKMGVAE